jgi:hypothetical protein
MVEGRVEDDLLVVRASFDLDAVEGIVPGGVCFLEYGVEGSACGVLGAEVGLGVGLAHVGDADAHANVRRLRGVEDDPST